MQLERTAIRHGGHGGYCVGAVGEHAAAEKEVAGRGRVGKVTRAALQRVAARNPVINAFTEVTAERALAEAAAIDARRAKKETLPPLTGVPYAVKNLYDIEGKVTLAGSIINRSNPPADQDAVLVARMREAGAILVGATNMDEYAYGFTTENTHYGATRNPHDLQRSAGGSSGGSAAAVAAGCVPLSLGSDTNGSIRVPASFCGLYGLKPTYGRLPRSGAFLFSASLDHLGPFARSAVDLAACYDALQGPDSNDTACSRRAAEPVMPEIDQGIAGLRITVADEYFEQHAHPGALAARDSVARALGAKKTVTFPEAGRARASAYIITATEAANLHFENLKSIDPGDLDIAGAALSLMVSSTCAGNFSRRGHRARPGDALSGSCVGRRYRHRGWQERAAASQYWHLDPADLIYWIAGGGRSGMERLSR